MGDTRGGVVDFRGLLATGGAFLFWGLVPPYWKLLADVESVELLCHRIAWSLPCLLLLIAARRSWHTLAEAVRAPAVRRTLLATTALITVNWGLFIWAVNHDRVLAASLGYFINPLVSVLLGFVFLRERLRPAGWIAVSLAALGVLILTVHLGRLPWVSLALAFSFGLYGLLRKVVRTGPIAGLTAEVTVLTPLCLGYLGWRAWHGIGAFGSHGLGTDLLLVVAGVVTTAPLLLFTYGARRLPLSTVGLLQYIAPSGQFVLAVAVYHEVFTGHHVVAFVCIWIALAVYSVDLRRSSAQRSAGARSHPTVGGGAR